jgi:hypothetical protein
MPRFPSFSNAIIANKRMPAPILPIDHDIKTAANHVVTVGG